MTPERWQKAKQICYSVLDRAPDERSALLDDLCADDPELRRDVELMIADAEAADDEDDQDVAPATWTPEAVGPYRILRVVGEGGMGVVYEAEQAEPHRTVALKVIRPGLTSPELLRRFRQETRALARLQHPGIAQIYEAGTAETPYGRQPYFAMEFIRGESLRSYHASHRLTVPHRLELMARICDAVHHAHQRGLIHRDLKPSNILIDDNGQPKILDFGVARLTDGDIQMTQHTGVGELIGTLAYMSPEQVLADPLEVDTRSDVYTLGVILYELLADRLPYTVSTRVHEAVRTIQQEDPIRLSAISRLYRGDLETIVAKALEKDKTRRYGSAAALAADIRRYLQNEPIAARPATATYQLRKFARRHRALVTGLAAVFIVLSAGIAATTREAILARRAERAAVAAEQTAQAVNDFLQNDLLAQAGASAQAGPGQKPDPDLKVRTALDRAAARIEGKFSGHPSVEASIRATIGRTYLDLGLYTEAERQLVRADEMRRRELGPGHPDTIRSMGDLATLYSLSGDWSKAEAVAIELVEACKRVGGEFQPECVAGLARLAQIYSDQGKFAQAEPQLASILDIQRRTLGEHHDETLTSMNNLALCYRRLGKDVQAERLYRETLELRQRVSGDEHPETLLVMNNLGGLYLAQSRFSEAEAVLTRMLERSRRGLGEEHLTTLIGMAGLSSAYTNLGRLSEAEALQARVVEMERRVLGESHPAALMAMSNLAMIQWRRDRFSDAVALQTQAIDLQRRALGEDHPDTITSRQYLARMLRSEGRFAEAESLLSSIVSTRQRLFGPESRVTLSALTDQGALYRSRGDHARAEETLAPALEVLRRIVGQDDAQTLAVQENLAEVHRLQGRLAEAEALLSASLDARRRIAGEQVPATANTQLALGRVLLEQRKFREAESLLRAALRYYEKTDPESWRRFQCASLLGASLSGLGSSDEAEALLVSGYEGMSQRHASIPVEDRVTVRATHQTLLQLYKTAGKPHKVAEWSRKVPPPGMR